MQNICMGNSFKFFVFIFDLQFKYLKIIKDHEQAAQFLTLPFAMAKPLYSLIITPKASNQNWKGKTFFFHLIIIIITISGFSTRYPIKYMYFHREIISEFLDKQRM